MEGSENQFRVLIVGGGVAALEASLALRDLAGERVAITMLTPGTEFVYRPMRVREPFAYSAARHYSLEQIACDLGLELVDDEFKWLDALGRAVHTKGGRELRYDALLLALGARMKPRYRHALTIDDRVLDEQLHGLIQDVESGDLHKLVFVVPQPMPWPLPVYELALMTAARAYDSGQELSITIVTPEDAPLAVFGSAVSDAVAGLLDRAGIVTIGAAHAEILQPGQVTLHPGRRTLHAERIVAMPALYGPSTPGVPKGSPDGFIPIDEHCRVRGLDRVYAAGDATDFAVKHGGIAAQQADAAAQSIAALVRDDVKPKPFDPVIRGILLGGERPLYLSAHVTGGHGSTSRISEEPPLGAAKISGRYVAPYLEALDSAATSQR